MCLSTIPSFKNNPRANYRAKVKKKNSLHEKKGNKLILHIVKDRM